MPCVHARACVCVCVCVCMRARGCAHTLMPSISNFEPGDELPRNLEHDGVEANPNAVCITNFTCM